MRAIVKLSLIVAWIAACVAVAALFGRCGAKQAKWSTIRTCYRGLLWIIGIAVTVRGSVSATRPLLLVSNHTTYLDVAVLGANLPARFCPKAEIAGWPFVGAICRLTECIFIDRRPQQTAANRTALQNALAERPIVSLFPEGTTGDGKRVLPFRSSYFSLAEEQFDGKPLAVQATRIAYTHVCGMPVDSTQRPKIAWYGDMELLPHVTELLKLGPIRAELTFFEAADITGFKDRKDLAAWCHRLVAEGRV